jgi:hypothetical protein
MMTGWREGRGGGIFGEQRRKRRGGGERIKEGPGNKVKTKKEDNNNKV